MAARKTHIAPVLTMHRGGTDPEVLLARETQAAAALMDLAVVVPPSDAMRDLVWRWATLCD